jgi:hypothetical protein
VYDRYVRLGRSTELHLNGWRKVFLACNRTALHEMTSRFAAAMRLAEHVLPLDVLPLGPGRLVTCMNRPASHVPHH